MDNILPLRIRRAEPRDLEALVMLETQVFDYDRMSRAQFRRHLTSRSALILIAETGPTLLGAAVIFFRIGITYARLYSLASAPRARGRGVGAALLDAAEAAARERGADRIGLEVRTDNNGAISFYEKHGYHRLGCHKGYYDDGADAYRYAKNLSLPVRSDKAAKN